MRCVVAGFVKGRFAFWRCYVGVGYCVSQVFLDMACSKGDARVCRGVNDNIAIEYSS